MKITIQPEKGEKFKKIEFKNVTDYFYSVRGKNKMGLPTSPSYGYKGEYAFILGWLEYIKEVVKREINGSSK